MCYRCAVAASTWRCAHPAVKTVFAVPAKLAAAKTKSAQWRCLVGGGTLAITHAISPDSARRQVGQDDRVALAGYLGCLDCYVFAAKEIALSVVGKNMSLVGPPDCQTDSCVRQCCPLPIDATAALLLFLHQFHLR